MKKIKPASVMLAGVFIIMVVYTMKILSRNTQDTVLRVGYPSYCGSLIPPLQHTVYGAALIENQFEPLVRRGANGIIEPLAAKSWVISADYRVFTFKIDVERKYSDGSSLKAEDFKKAWENGLELEIKAANHSLRDVLYKVEGFANFGKTKKLSGVKALSDDTLEVRFQTPFRIGLDHLSGKRLAVYKLVNGAFIGTGPFIMEENAESKRIKLTRNAFSTEKPAFGEIHVMSINQRDAQKHLSSGEIDVFAFAETANLTSCDQDSSPIACFSGQESSHRILDVNGLPRRFFSNSKYRMALQSLIAREIVLNSASDVYSTDFFRPDLQVYLPFQSGRLSEESLRQIIDEGAQFIDEMIHATNDRPVYYITAASTNRLQPALEKFGMKFTRNSGYVDLKKRYSMLYKTFEPDLIFGSITVVNSDPDGIYHALGKDGAIYSPITYRESVGKLLEEGRSFVDANKLDSHYRRVSEAVLRDVPFVHLGFLFGAVAYRSDRIAVSDTLRTRNDYRFNIYSPK